MIRRASGVAVLCLAVPLSCLAQASFSAQSEILRTMIATEAAARIEMPFGGEGVLLSDKGQVNQDKLQKQIQKNGKSVQTGRVVSLTGISFGDKSIDIELDGGGKDKRRLGDHVQVSVGGATTAPSRTSSAPKVRGSKVELSFAGKVPSNLTSDDLRLLLSPVLDFTKHSLAGITTDTLPPEFKEAVLAKEARVGMDEDTVFLALGRPNHRYTEKVDGVEQVEWEYDGKGTSRTFVTFENNLVVKITEY